MSAFLVGGATINAAVTLIAARSGEASTDKLSDLGRAMWTLNAQALEQRYGDDPTEVAGSIAAYRFEPVSRSEAVCYKSLRCWLYQCAEGDIPETSDLYKSLEAMSKVLEKAGWDESSDYEAAPWGLCAEEA